MAAEQMFQMLADAWFRRLPRPRPVAERLSRCRIVAHRGAHDNRSVIENTLAAFDLALQSGIWGIEFDIRWTADLVPVVAHDADLDRLYDIPRTIGRLSRSELAALCPAIPDLATVVARYGGKVHLMAEMKKEPCPDPRYQERVLLEILSGLVPCEDYHILSLDPEVFDCFPAIPRKVLLPISFGTLSRFSRLAIRKGYAGVTGHYLPMTGRTISRHHRLGQKVGAGFIASPRSLYRELNRGVDWIFSDCPLDLLKALDVTGSRGETPVRPPG